MRFALILGLVASAILVFFWLEPDQQDAPLTQGQFARLIFTGVILVASVSALAAYRNRLGVAAQHFALWFGLFAVMIVGYAYQSELKEVANRSLGVLVPGIMLWDSPPGSAVIAKASDGHFYVHALVDGGKQRVRFVVDTGASTVVLTQSDAQILGFSPSDAAYTVGVSTANGSTTAAPIVLASIDIGDVSVGPVRALVARPGALRTSLLGNSFLERLAAFSFEGNRLILKR